MRSFDIVRNNNNPLKKCLKLRKKINKKGAMVFNASGKKEKKNWPSKGKFYPFR